MKGQRKPTALKIIDGERHKDRIRDDEPKPRPKAPQAPEHLNEIARAEWERFSPILERLGLLTENDLGPFSAYCELWSQNVRLSRRLSELGNPTTLVHVDKAGNQVEKAHPLETAKQRVLKDLLPYIKEFGMSPSSRTRISVPGSKGSDDFEELLD